MVDEHRLDELLDRWEELQAGQQPVTAEELCRNCPELLDEVRERIGRLQALDSLLHHEATQPDSPAGGPVVPGRYRAVRFHDRGGLGEVFVALDEELRRKVALKRIQAGCAGDREARQRFLREAEITGRLEHPGIVPVYGLVSDGQGQPCYAMRFIHGQTLREAIDQFHKADLRRADPHRANLPSRDPGERSLDFQKLIRAFLTVCQTVAYAHSRGIIHRDLKPANIMLERFGETLVVDWGLAKPLTGTGTTSAAGAAGADDSILLALASPGSDVETIGIKGSPVYMSPEQAAGRWEEVGTASDIYSLGATLYVLLTGQPPVAGGSAVEVMAKVQRGEFPPPRRVNATVPTPLEAICLKAMRLRPSDRYATASDLAADVEHYLADEPVAAASEPFSARAQRWLRRHKAWLTGGVGVLLVSIGGLLLLALQQRQANADITKQRDQARDNLAAARHNLYVSRTNLAGFARAEGKYQRARDLLMAEQPLPGDEYDNRGPEWYELWHFFHRDAFALGVPAESIGGRLSADGQRLAVTGRERVTIYDTQQGSERFSIPLPYKGDEGYRHAISSDLAWLAVIWGKEVHVWPLREPGQSVEKQSFTRDAKSFGAKASTWESFPANLAFSGDSRTLAVVWRDGYVQVWNTAEGRLKTAAEAFRWKLSGWSSEGYVHLALSPDGNQLACGWREEGRNPGNPSRVGVWKIDGPPQEGARSEGDVIGLSWVGEGPVVASSARDVISVVRPGHESEPLWSYPRPQGMYNGKRVVLAEGTGGTVSAMLEASRGLHIVAGSADSPRRSTLIPLPQGATHLGFSPDARFAWAMDQAGSVVVWRCDEVLDSFRLPGWDLFVHSVICLEGDRWLALVVPMQIPIADSHEPKWERKLICGDRTGRELWSVEIKSRLMDVQPNPDLFLAPDGRHVAVVGNGAVRWFEVATGREARADAVPEIRLPTLPALPPGEFLPNALSVPARLVARAQGRIVRVWSFDEKPIVWDDRLALPAKCSRLAFSADGRLLAVGADDGSVAVWRTDDWSQVLLSAAHSDSVTALAFWPDGEQLLTAGGEGKVILWDLRERIERFLWHVGERPSALAVSRDGKTLAIATSFSTVHFYRCPGQSDVLELARRRARFDTASTQRDLAVAAWGTYLEGIGRSDLPRATQALTEGLLALDAFRKLVPSSAEAKDWREAFSEAQRQLSR